MTDYRPVTTLVSQSLAPRRFMMTLITAFAGLSLMLAAVGIYGVVSYSVSQRTQEIGIRMALGASAGGVRVGVLSETFRLAAIGIGLGLSAALLASPLLSSMLFGISPGDPTTYAVVALVLLVVALGAGYLPARRASSVDPLTALRDNR